MVTLAIQSKSILNLTSKASSWMITFDTKEMNYPLINGNRNTKEEMSYMKQMT